MQAAKLVRPGNPALQCPTGMAALRHQLFLSVLVHALLLLCLPLNAAKMTAAWFSPAFASDLLLIHLLSRRAPGRSPMSAQACPSLKREDRDEQEA